MVKSVLVTGGAGFIGSHLCARLLNLGHHILCLDNFFTGSWENILSLKEHPHFEIVRHDVINPYMAEVDWIFNLACPASPVHYQHNPIKTVKTSIIGTLNMLGLAKRVGATIFQASTSEVYGDPLVHPQIEEYWGNVNPIGPRACYDEGKRAAETLCFEYHRMNNVPIRVVRIFNTYGPNMASGDGRVVSNFIVQALRGEKITIYGDGSQTRSFCYVDDLLDGFLLMMKNEKIIGPVNLGNPHETTILELAEKVINLTESSSQIVFEDDLPQDDPVRRCPDISRAKSAFGFAPSISLDEGLSRTIDYFRTQVDQS